MRENCRAILAVFYSSMVLTVRKETRDKLELDMYFTLPLKQIDTSAVCKHNANGWKVLPQVWMLAL